MEVLAKVHVQILVVLVVEKIVRVIVLHHVMKDVLVLV